MNKTNQDRWRDRFTGTFWPTANSFLLISLINVCTLYLDSKSRRFYRSSPSSDGGLERWLLLLHFLVVRFQQLSWNWMTDSARGRERSRWLSAEYVAIYRVSTEKKGKYRDRKPGANKPNLINDGWANTRTHTHIYIASKLCIFN